jgi:membrane protein
MVSLSSPLLPTALAILGCTLFYYVVPNRPVLFRHAVIGATVAGLGLALLKGGFAFYLKTFPTYQTLYGALSIVPVFLVWTYLTWAVILAGAVVTAALPEWGLTAAETDEPASPATRLRTAVALLGALYDATRNEAGRGIGRRRLLRSAGMPAIADADATLTTLRAAGYVGVTTDGDWLPRRDAASVTLFQLARDLGLAAEINEAPSAGSPAWRVRLDELLAADSQARRSLFSMTLGSLYAAPDAPNGAGEAAVTALALRRTP